MENEPSNITVESPKKHAPWKPGESGNLAGKPKGTLNRATIIARWLDAIVVDGLTEGDRVVLAQIQEALEGDTQAFNALMDGRYGKLSDKVEHTGKDGEKLDGLNVTFVGGKKDGQ